MQTLLFCWSTFWCRPLGTCNTWLRCGHKAKVSSSEIPAAPGPPQTRRDTGDRSEAVMDQFVPQTLYSRRTISLRAKVLAQIVDLFLQRFWSFLGIPLELGNLQFQHLELVWSLPRCRPHHGWWYVVAWTVGPWRWLPKTPKLPGHSCRWSKKTIFQGIPPAGWPA